MTLTPNMFQKWLNEVIENHRHWLLRDCEGWTTMKADFSNAYISYSNLSNANFSGADFRNAQLHRSDLTNTNLSGADLSGADLSGAYLSGADFFHAKLDGADLSGADLSGAKNLVFPMSCPSHGEFTAWKKLDNKIIKLIIPEDARRQSATGRKCRCDKAFVAAIDNIDGTDSGLTEITNLSYTPIVYKIGEMVYPDYFDEDRWNECSHGIHFFVDRDEAVRY